jgi:hypothetical protein
MRQNRIIHRELTAEVSYKVRVTTNGKTENWLSRPERVNIAKSDENFLVEPHIPRLMDQVHEL